MSPKHLEDLKILYPVDMDGYEAAVQFDAEELHFTLDGKVVTELGSNK